MPVTTGILRVRYREVEPYREQFVREALEIVRTCDVEWRRKNEFVWDMLGWVEYRSGALLTRFLPDVFPAFSGALSQPVLYAAECRLVDCLGVPDIGPITGTLRYLDKEPLDDIPDPGEEEWGLARYEVTYRPRTYRVLADGQVTSELQRYVTRLSTPSVFNYSVPGNILKWADIPGPPPKPIPETLVKTEFTEELTYILHQVPLDLEGRLPAGLRTNIRRCQGKSNSGPFDGNEFAPEELLCLAPAIEVYHSAHGDRVADVHFKFVFRRSEPFTGWNTSFRRDNAAGALAPGFYPIIGMDGLSKLYPPVDFNQLFRFN